MHMPERAQPLANWLDTDTTVYRDWPPGPPSWGRSKKEFT